MGPGTGPGARRRLRRGRERCGHASACVCVRARACVCARACCVCASVGADAAAARAAAAAASAAARARCTRAEAARAVAAPGDLGPIGGPAALIAMPDAPGPAAVRTAVGAARISGAAAAPADRPSPSAGHRSRPQHPEPRPRRHWSCRRRRPFRSARERQRAFLARTAQRKGARVSRTHAIARTTPLRPPRLPPWPWPRRCPNRTTTPMSCSASARALAPSWRKRVAAAAAAAARKSSNVATTRSVRRDAGAVSRDAAAHSCAVRPGRALCARRMRARSAALLATRRLAGAATAGGGPVRRRVTHGASSGALARHAVCCANSAAGTRWGTFCYPC